MSIKLVKALLALLVIAIGHLYYLSFDRDSVLAYVETNRLMEGANEMTDLQKEFQAEREQAMARVDTLTLEFQQELMRHERQVSSMTEKEKELSKGLLQSKRQQILQYQEAVMEKLSQREQELTSKFLQRTNKLIAEYGEDNGYQVILGTVNGNILYGDKAMDVTDEVIRKINE